MLIDDRKKYFQAAQMDSQDNQIKLPLTNNDTSSLDVKSKDEKFRLLLVISIYNLESLNVDS